MKILVTGATGRVGQYLVSQLNDAGHQVVALTRNPTGTSFPAGVEVVKGDLTQPETLAAALDGVDGLVFTGTVGERAVAIRQRVIEGLDYLNLVINQDTNKQCTRPTKITTISQPHSKPIFVVPTDEASEMCRIIQRFIKDGKKAK